MIPASSGTRPPAVPVEAPVTWTGFDGGVRGPVRISRPDRYRDLRLPAAAGPRTCLGGGFSYSPAGFRRGGLVVAHERFNRILAFDATTGIVECEGGTTLGQLYEFLAPRARFLPVQPGYPGITVGGCVATDVHGKNQYRDRTFRAHVAGLRLYHPRYGDLDLSRESGGEAFDLTCGGLGLTGNILSVRLRTMPVPGAAVELVRDSLPSFEAVLPALEGAGPQSDFLYTWHDATRRGKDFGKGFLVRGRFAGSAPASDAFQTPGKWHRITAASRGRGLPPLLNSMSARPFNRLFGLAQSLGPRRRSIGLFEFLFPVARKVVYFHLFGRRGFHEMQWIVPAAAAGELVRELPRLLQRRRAPITLASCKLFRGTPSLVRFDGEGLCIALDFPRSPDSEGLASELDRLGGDLGVIPNLVKDSRIPARVAEAGLPGMTEFRQRLERWDPDRLFRSDLSERLGL